MISSPLSVSGVYYLCEVVIQANVCEYRFQDKFKKCFQLVQQLLLIMYVSRFYLNSDCWNQWSSWSNCTYGECGFHMGTKTRNRTCLCDESTSFGAESCPTDSNQTIQCDPSWGSDDCPLGLWFKMSGS